MPKSSGALLFAIAGVFALGSVACSRLVTSAKPKAVMSTGSPTAQPTPTAPETLQDESYRLALDRADSASSITESAQSPEDWELVIGRWQQAIALLKQVPPHDPNKKFALQKLRDYQRNLAIAQGRAKGMGTDKIKVIDPGFSIDEPLDKTQLTPSYSAGDAVYRVKIKYRKHRIPVIDVIFNGSQRYEMMVDTGASNTMINEEMAERLGVKIVGTSKAQTAAGVTDVNIGFLNSISVGNNTIVDVPVSIGPLEVGLLGHDLFGDCDLSIKRDVVEFSQCQKNK